MRHEARRDPRRGHGALRPGRLRAHEVGGHRGRRRRRPDRAVPLLRVQAALPLRDHGRGDRGLPRPLRGDHRATATTRSSARSRSSTTASSSPSTTSCATACSSPSRACCPAAAAHRARSRRGRPRARARATWSSRGRASSPRAMQQGAIPENDPRLLTRAVLGLYNSIWHWYRPNGIVALRPRRRVLHRAQPGADRRAARQRSSARGRRHELLRALLRGARRARAALVARARRRRRRVLDPVGRRRRIARAASSSAAARSCARFIDAGDMGGWAHYVAVRRRPTATSSSRSARRAGTTAAHRHVPRGRAARRRRADGRYMVARSPRDRLRAGAGRCRSVSRRRRRRPDRRDRRGAGADRLASAGAAASSRSRARHRARLHVERRRGAPARPPRDAVDLDDPALPARSRRPTPARPRTSSPTASATSSCRARCASRRG